MKVFLDFEASSLADRSYPVEVAWVFQDGRGESHLIAPAPGWTDWDEAAERIHGISRATLEAEGEPHDVVAERMVEVLSEHDLFASAPSWDGKWLSVLLRAAGQPRHRLRLRDTDEALRATAAEILGPALAEAKLESVVHDLVARFGSAPDGTPAHRALADARVEQERWLRVRHEARLFVTTLP
ncbi:transcriptional regulator [Sphingomonas sp. BK069]|uniref:3'-5' exonuclease n=1 Tax=Sphingomonas sp. BK069 TaxID=2586979 RepID=UPI00161CDD82|nr:transcriptional regulator [Sphingomonas sp. BK069]MBB3348380.1 DNA polymerase III epsilon subunit-like protein [Sphingomonas sp. BK069]